MLISAGNFFKVKILWRIVRVLICTKLHEKWKTHHRKSRRTKFWQRALFLISTLVTWKMHSFSANQTRVIFFFMYIINISIIVLVNITLTSTVTLTISIVIIIIIWIIIITIGVTIIIIIWLSLLTRVMVTFGPTRLPTIDNKFVSKCDSFLITIVTSMIRKVWWSVITSTTAVYIENCENLLRSATILSQSTTIIEKCHRTHLAPTRGVRFQYQLSVYLN